MGSCHFIQHVWDSNRSLLVGGFLVPQCNQSCPYDMSTHKFRDGAILNLVDEDIQSTKTGFAFSQDRHHVATPARWTRSSSSVTIKDGLLHVAVRWDRHPGSINWEL